MVNTNYVTWLVNFIKNGTVNISTNAAFNINDIKLQEYKDAVITEFKVEVVSGAITIAQYKQYTGLDYTA